MLLAVSVAWGLSGAAKAGDVDAFAHIDDALQPPVAWGCVKAPPGGCVMVEGEPFFISEGEQGMLRFLWDGFAIFIDHEGCERVRQEFFDLADLRQSKAYAVMGECNQEYQQQLNNQEVQGEEILQENRQEVRENQQEIRENRHHTQQSTAKNCSDDNPSLEISSKERISKENYSNDTPYTANCQNSQQCLNSQQCQNSQQCLDSQQCQNSQQCLDSQNSLKHTPPTFKEMLLWGIAYACDIDRVKPEEVETIKDLLEGYLDSPYAEGLTSDDILLISKKLRGIKQCRINRLRAREEEAELKRLEAEQKRLEAEQNLMSKLTDNAGVSPVTNNFYGSIGQWIASVGMVSSEFPKDKGNVNNQKKE